MDLETAYDQLIGAICIWREFRGESAKAKLAGWWVIKNRLASGRWGDTIQEVVTAPWQFSAFNKDDPNSILFPKHGDWAWAECLQTVEDNQPDPTNGAMYYYSKIIPKPSWAEKMVLTLVEGKTEFYREA